jgi:hypothetical protein
MRSQVVIRLLALIVSATASRNVLEAGRCCYVLCRRPAPEASTRSRRPLLGEEDKEEGEVTRPSYHQYVLRNDMSHPLWLQQNAHADAAAGACYSGNGLGGTSIGNLRSMPRRSYLARSTSSKRHLPCPDNLHELLLIPRDEQSHRNFFRGTRCEAGREIVPWQLGVRGAHLQTPDVFLLERSRTGSIHSVALLAQCAY